MRVINQYDVFELIKDINPNVRTGLQGVILEVLDKDAYIVEFVKKDGSNYEFEGEFTFILDSSFIGDLYQKNSINKTWFIIIELLLKNIYTKPNGQVPSYLDVIFDTSNGLFRVGFGELRHQQSIDLSDYSENPLPTCLKNDRDVITIDDIRVTYDNDMYFLLSGRCILVMGYVPNTYSEVSQQTFWIIDEIYGTNRSDLDEFMELEKATFKI
jgi:hypothetical protein